jgi:hypothetical protein
MNPGQQVSEEIAGLWRQMGNVTRAVTLFDVRFDRIDGDIAVLKTDVAEIKTDLGATKEQLNRLERATESRFNRVDAQLERLVALIQRDEFKKS